MLSEMVQPCPMCGGMIAAEVATCPGCGERLDSSREPDEFDPDTARESNYQTLLNLMGFLWIGWGLFSGCASLPFSLDAGSIEAPVPLILMTYMVCALAWLVSGIAALRREMWGVYLGYVISWLSLLTNLIYLEPIGIFVSVCFILLSRYVLKQYRRLKGSNNPTDDE